MNAARSYNPRVGQPKKNVEIRIRRLAENRIRVFKYPGFSLIIWVSHLTLPLDYFPLDSLPLDSLCLNSLPLNHEMVILVAACLELWGAPQMNRFYTQFHRFDKFLLVFFRLS